MSHITIECPNCNTEHVESWSMGRFCFGQFVCRCGKVIEFRVQTLDPDMLGRIAIKESEAKRG